MLCTEIQGLFTFCKVKIHTFTHVCIDHVPSIRVPTVVVETCLTLLVVLKFLFNYLPTTPPTHTIMVFIRDGAWAFALVFGQDIAILQYLYLLIFIAS
jgi:hypothetical protein